MKILMLSNEYPPNVYGGAGVHVDYLCRDLERLCGSEHSLQVFCFGDQQERSSHFSVTGFGDMSAQFDGEGGSLKVLDALGRNIVMAARAAGADLVHCHTWYTYFAGCLVKQFLEIPMVITVHSLEPKRPWKREQIGPGYFVSSWLEKTAMENADGVIAVAVGNDGQFVKFCEVAGCAELSAHPSYRRNADRVRNREEILAILEPIVRARPVAFWTEQLEAAGVPCGPINNIAQALADKMKLTPQQIGKACKIGECVPK